MPKLKLKYVLESVKAYLKTFWQGAQGGSVTMRRLADAPGVSDASVAGMLTKLRDPGLAHRTRYHGAELIPAGAQGARLQVRRHRLVGTFLIGYLDYDRDEVYGDPISRTNGTLPDTPNMLLAEVAAGLALQVSRFLVQASDVLSYLLLGVQPGVQFQGIWREPLGGLVHVARSSRREVLAKDTAMLIRGAVVA